jgi:hypothetical protein
MRFLVRLIKYLFPPRKTRQKLPLLSLRWSSDQCPYPSKRNFDYEIYMLQAAGVARTPEDCLRLLHTYGPWCQTIIQAERRKRRFKPRLVRAWERLQRIW